MTQMEASHEAQKRYGKRAILWSDKKGKRLAIYVRRLSGQQQLKGVGDSWEAALQDAERRQENNACRITRSVYTIDV